MGKKNHYDGPKHRGNHTTVIDPAAKMIKAAAKLTIVTGICPGPIFQAKSRLPRIKYLKTDTGLKATVLSSNTKQIVILFTTDPDSLESHLDDVL